MKFIKAAHLLLLFSLVLAWAAPALAASGTLSDCLLGCPPGNSACAQCCTNAFPGCSSECMEQFRSCWRSCGADESCFDNCLRSLDSCQQGCRGQVASFSCPGWADPNQKCPYDCQRWNPATQKCVGAPMNGCSQ